jgi:hypothetical protein
MNLVEAVEYMQKSENVADWNARRDHVFTKFAGDVKELILAVDSPDEEGRGLIVKTLGKDQPEIQEGK